MDREEIKQSRSMGDVVALYGLHPNRAGFICCPFHKEKTASLKIYKDSFYCFGCGASGDIFKFVERMEGVSFKDAFLLLGGDYPDKSKESNFARRMKQYHFEKQREMRQKEQAALDVKKQENGKKLDLYRDFFFPSSSHSSVIMRPSTMVSCPLWNHLFKNSAVCPHALQGR